MKKLLTFVAYYSLCLPVFAADLTIYTYDSFVSEWGPGPQLEKAFEAQCQCDLEYIAVEDGVSILNRLRIEKDRTKADVILGIDDALIEETRREGLVIPHQQPLNGLKQELQWQDTDFLPIDYGYFAFIYDSQKITTPATSLKQIIESDASIIYQDPRTSTPGQGLMLWVKSVYGEQADQAWQQLAPHTVTVTKGWWEAYSLFLKGDADYVLSYNTSPAYHVVAEGKDHYRAAQFKEGHVAQIEVAAITRTSTNPELARDFLAFLISTEAQTIIPTSNWMLPVIEGIELPEVFDQLIAPERIGFTPTEVAQQRRRWIKEWRSETAR
ncbi:thiamine ABC transporter substrate binding subunit [Amphritea balenae]|uniref:Thiamine-binding periplasmic protein n=1 Tax=Amphritea balenae TaxID=452629 RepID=A0A3P1SR10_9GAMM|nr:thiamine ABC transporter substrate binding subunit [Amphritea balenae]RRC99593.1 thiamine ABC transporter substrate binding subunit [Amphritea balenae]GGK78299.1 thiamine transporter substrate binding subunit [Amphritea balenae]